MLGRRGDVVDTLTAMLGLETMWASDVFGLACGPSSLACRPTPRPRGNNRIFRIGEAHRRGKSGLPLGERETPLLVLFAVQDPR